MKSFISLVFFLLFSITISSQDYSAIDAKVKQYPKQFRSIEYLAKRIDKDFDSESEKIRAVYFWLANNVMYNFDEKEELARKKLNKESFTKHLYNTNKYKYAETALINKKAICSGYSLLFKYLLEELDITCEYITGSAKTEGREIGVKSNMENHAWNAVKINGEWKLIDLTWSTGNRKEEPNVFDFSDTYYLISPKKLILNHFPNDKKWQLLKQPISKSEFIYKPLFYSPYFNSGLKLNSKTLGLIRNQVNKPITLVFDTIDTSKKYYFHFKGDAHSKPLTFIKKNNTFYTTIKFNSTRRNYLTIYEGSNGLIQFKVLPSKNTSR